MLICAKSFVEGLFFPFKNRIRLEEIQIKTSLLFDMDIEYEGNMQEGFHGTVMLNEG